MTPMMLVHVAAGAVALSTGAAALVMPKGTPLHRVIGTVFYASMLLMSALGIYFAAIMPERGTMMIGVLTIYLVATAWAAARRRRTGIGWTDYAAPMFGIAAGTIFIMFGLTAAGNPNGRLDFFPAFVFWPFAAIAGLGAVLDMKVLFQDGISGAARISRHVWRMCTALLIASVAFFIGQQQSLPENLRGPWLFAPPLLVLATMISWMVRLRLGARFGAAAPVAS